MLIEELILRIGADTAAFIGATLAGFAGYYINKGMEAWKKHRRIKANNSIPDLIKKDIGVYRDLTELLVETTADRAFVMQFHNGTYYVNQANQMKMSCTHEIVREGISREQDKMQDLLLSRFPTVVGDIISNSSIVITVGKQDYYFEQLLRHQGVMKCFVAVMRDGALIEGLIGVSYVAEESSKTDREIMKTLESYTNKIGFTLRLNNE